MAVFELNNVKVYIGDRLKSQLDKKVIPDLQRKDKDVVFIVDGGEGTGKSTQGINSLGGYIASQLKTHYQLDNICMTPEEFKKRIMTANKNEVVVFDEGHRGFGSISVLSEINKILTDLMMEMRQKNLCVIIIMPTFFMLNKYVALFRARGLFHIYERKGNRGFWVYFNKKNKLTLYLKGKKDLNYNCIHWPRFRNRFYNQWVINEEEYKEKKRKAFETKPRIIKAEKYIKQRDTFIYILNKELNLSQRKIAELCKRYKIELTRAGIQSILEKFNPKSEDNGEKDESDEENE